MYQKLQSGIRCIIGPFGCGKGTLNAILATMEMDDEERYEQSVQAINELQDKYDKLYSLPPQKHVVHANFDLKHNDKIAYKFDEDKFMLPNEKYEYNLLEPCACVHIEEGQSGILNGYEWSTFPKPALLAYARLRHNKYLFTIDLQNIDDLNKKVRRFAFEYLRPMHIENEYDIFGNLTETKVYVVGFYNYNKALEFSETEDLSLVDDWRVYKYEGDIYSCFDSEGKKYEYTEGSGNKDFCYGSSVKVEDMKTQKITEIVA